MPQPNDAFREKYGPWAFVAGASEGIGESFAEQLAAAGINLVMVARRQPVLEATADRIRKAHNVEIRTHSLDLSAEDLSQRVRPLIEDIDVGLLIYNAAYAPSGAFLERDVDEHMKAIDINVRGPMVLAHLFGQRLARRGRGGIILMSSMSGYQGSAIVANYAGTKAYNRIFAEGLWYELRHVGVDVLGCIAGPTLTPSYEGFTKRKPSNWLALPMKADEVAEQALQDLGQTPSGVSGRRNRFAAALMNRILPRRSAINITSKEIERMYL